MSYLERIYTCNNADLAGYYPWLIGQVSYGWVSPEFTQYLQQWPEIFCLNDQVLNLNPAFTDYTARTLATAPVLRTLYEQGVIDTWVNESYPVTLSFGGHAEMEIERAASNFLGIKTFGIHLNGLVKKQDGIYVWVGTRSLDKPFWPGKLDQMVAGGLPVGISLMDNVIKESQEEANIPMNLAQNAQWVGTIDYQQQSWRGLENSTIYIYDLWLPENFIPKNTDGEVINFQLLSLAEIAYLTENTDYFKDNCNLVNIDLLLRTGMLNSKHPDYAAIRDALYNSGKRDT